MPFFQIINLSSIIYEISSLSADNWQIYQFFTFKNEFFSKIIIISCFSFSFIIMYKEGRLFRTSANFSRPQSYVTVQIRNKSIRKKFVHHRNSVLNQIHATQSILNDSLSKISPPIKTAYITPKNPKFEPLMIPNELKFSEFLRQKQKKLKMNRRNDVKFKPKFRICDQIKNKLKQITNITHYFEQACGQRPKILKTEASETSQSYLLPNLDQSKLYSCLENENYKKFSKNWIKKLKNGKGFVEKIKKRLSQEYLQKPSTEQAFQVINKNIYEKDVQEDKQKENQRGKVSLRDVYFGKQEQERKSAPLSNRSSTFYKLFCSARNSQKLGARQMIQVQAEQVRKLQQFVSGIQLSQFKEYDKLIHMNDFIKDRQNFEVLKKMYDYVKETYAYKLKEVNLQSVKESNLLSLVYYLENKGSMTEQQKKNWKLKLNLVE